MDALLITALAVGVFVVVLGLGLAWAMAGEYMRGPYDPSEFDVRDDEPRGVLQRADEREIVQEAEYLTRDAAAAGR